MSFLERNALRGVCEYALDAVLISFLYLLHLDKDAGGGFEAGEVR